MKSLTLGLSPDLAQLGVVVERLPIGVLIFEKERKEVTFANLAARRLLRPTVIRVRGPIPEPWPSFSLRRYAEGLVQPGVAPDKRVQLPGDRVYQVSGVTARETTSGAILIEDVSEQERRSRAEREFVANAAHELLTPLTGIVGAAHVLQSGAKDVPEDRDRFMAHIEAECSRLTRIARSLLILARAQSGEEPPRLEILRLRELLDEATELLDADVTIRCDDEFAVFADADLLVQAVSNLIANAVRHGSGAVVVEARTVGVNLVEVDIVDTEPSTSRASEFQERFRSAAGRDGGGFGLGLSIAAQSLEVMGGRLMLDGGLTRMQLSGGGFTDK